MNAREQHHINQAGSLFVTVPETTLPNGIVVPAFEVGRYACAPGEPHANGVACRRIGDRVPRGATVAADAYPWTRVSYADARKACAAAGLKLITELQWLALAHDIASQDDNWSSDQVGEGQLFQGLHLNRVDCAMPGDFKPADVDERRWFVLSTGEIIYDVAGNAFSWVFDDVQGDAEGLVARRFADDSASLLAPYPKLERGMGWRPDAGADWSGRALIRGGCWDSDVIAGAFYLSGGWPGGARDYVGFRCTR